ncbi:hypothetical protein ASPSYDRAFT_27811 [Aspergillus sydowii CBS 593.65]|uniref:Secreted protein n=1 Tax=Aspergillus sydowii CBS 593.65 TaxID=1036612 RepID=A0A1L9TRU3_9EURO|nr:uncharacterized protein ASPSYDRAFT_27811 [Aspergillus sydowii CBS 593.65]OJJ62160.1 hypothetical protein ASPSYDRAFT_27811 [Aspergillus sydowii CBS 593.65]
MRPACSLAPLLLVPLSTASTHLIPSFSSSIHSAAAPLPFRIVIGHSRLSTGHHRDFSPHQQATSPSKRDPPQRYDTVPVQSCRLTTRLTAVVWEAPLSKAPTPSLSINSSSRPL